MTPGMSLRRVAGAVAYGGGGLSLVGATFGGLIAAEVAAARRLIGNAEGDPPSATGWYGHGRPGPAVKIALLGDSSAAGYGVDHVEETPGAHLASNIAEALDRRVYLVSSAKVGAQTKDLDAQIDRVLHVEPSVAVIFIGANDVTHAVTIPASLRNLRRALERLDAAGVSVVVATCPDLGTIEPLAPPLKQVARVWSRRLAAAQSAVVVECGARSVAMASILASEFIAMSQLLFGPDRFHPSAAGYARMASAVLPTVLATLGLEAEDETPEYARGEALLPLDIAVAEAARHPGASVEPPTTEQAAAPGVRGRFVQLRRRRRLPEAAVESPTATESG